MSQHFRYGRGVFVFWRAKGRRSGERLRVEPPRFYRDLLRYPSGSPACAGGGRWRRCWR